MVPIFTPPDGQIYPIGVPDSAHMLPGFRKYCRAFISVLCYQHNHSSLKRKHQAFVLESRKCAFILLIQRNLSSECSQGNLTEQINFQPYSLKNGPRGLTFTWWGCCCGLCQSHQPTELAHSFFFFNSVLVYIFVFMALSTVFHSINSPDNSPFSHSVLPVLSLPYRSFRLYISLWKSPSALI